MLGGPENPDGADGTDCTMDGLAAGWGANGRGAAWDGAVAAGAGAFVGPVISPFRSLSSSRYRVICSSPLARTTILSLICLSI